MSLSSASSTPVTVVVSRTGGTATSGTDFAAFAPVTLTFAAGETSKTVTVQVIGDTALEASETVVLGLSSVSGATLGTTSGTLTILNDDAKLVATAVGPGTGTRCPPGSCAGRCGLRWPGGGTTVRPRRQLAGVRVLQRSMLGTDLAETAGRTITLDADAAGWGWSTSRIPVTGRMDLFSVLVHELGHVLGMSHTGHGVMEPVLSPGQLLARH